jgi:hypothetical protein
MKHYRWNAKTFARNVIIPLQFIIGFFFVLCAPGIPDLGQAVFLSGAGLLMLSGAMAL